MKLEDDLMAIPALGRSFKLYSGVHFTKMVEGMDRHGLVGHVKTDAQLNALGAERCGASVLFGDVGYECVEGFIGVPIEATSLGASGLIQLGG